MIRSGRANVGNTADPEQVKKATKKEKREHEEAIQDIKRLLATDFGKRFIWRYLEKCNVFYTLQGPVPNIHYEEGYRQVGLDMMNEIIEVDPGTLILMMSDAMKDSS